MFNTEYIKYTIKHNKAINMLAEKMGIDASILKRIRYHDMDKALNYLIKSAITAHKEHVTNASHHLESHVERQISDYIEMVLDWESARYTKEDKPLNAFQTLNKYYSEHKTCIKPILERLNLNKDSCAMIPEIYAKLKNVDVTNEEVLNNIIDYINYLRKNKIKTYYNLNEAVLKIYQSLNIKEQIYFKNHMDSDYLKQILSFKKKIRIGVFTHKNPDYDAIASSLAIASYITDSTNKEDIEVIPVIENTELLQEIKSDLKVYTVEEAKKIPLCYAIICDVNEKDRIYGLDLINSVDLNKRYLMDHHDKNREEIEMLGTNKLVLPNHSSTCEIVTEFLVHNGFQIPKDMAHNLYYGMASDTASFERSVTLNTEKMVNCLGLTEQEKKEILGNMNKMTPEQEKLYNKIKVLDTDAGLKIYTLLEPIEAGDITKKLKHKKFDQLTGPNVENPVTCFIIGCGNNYFLKLKKIPECSIDLLTIATNCNGGGHENRCAGRFYNTNFQTVLNKLLKEFHLAKSKSPNNDQDSQVRKLTLSNQKN